jgi:hypothetical protein
MWKFCQLVLAGCIYSSQCWFTPVASDTTVSSSEGCATQIVLILYERVVFLFFGMGVVSL